MRAAGYAATQVASTAGVDRPHLAAAAWVDPKGSFLAAVGAGPVYELLGKKGLGTTDVPPIDSALIDVDIGFHQHTEGHVPGPTWPSFLAFAERRLGCGCA